VPDNDPYRSVPQVTSSLPGQKCHPKPAAEHSKSVTWTYWQDWRQRFVAPFERACTLFRTGHLFGRFLAAPTLLFLWQIPRLPAELLLLPL
jgi:hypothetical protein